MTEFEFKSALVCEDCRREDSGKLLLVGVYSGGIYTQEPLPFNFQPTFYLAGFAKPGKHNIEFKFLPPFKGKPLAGGKGNLVIGGENVDHRGMAVFGFPMQAPILQFIDEGFHRLQLRVGSGRWKTVLKIYVGVAESTDNEPSSAPA